jgi:enoyl-CoA hydratase/carnithine racemase
MSDHILVSIEAGVCTIRMQRPEKKNALTQPMYRAMADALEAAATDDAVGAVLITGTEDCFTAGNDIGDFRARQQPLQESGTKRLYTALATYAKPVVASVGGLAIGIGTTMLLHCDLVYASSTARFRTPFVDLGLVPELGSSLLLPRLAGRHRAAELLLLADVFDAATAQEIGLVTRVCPPEALAETALTAARRLAAKPAQALRLTKALMRRDTEAVMAQIAEETRLFGEQLLSAETQAILAQVLKPAAPKAAPSAAA